LIKKFPFSKNITFCTNKSISSNSSVGTGTDCDTRTGDRILWVRLSDNETDHSFPSQVEIPKMTGTLVSLLYAFPWCCGWRTERLQVSVIYQSNVYTVSWRYYPL